ncbi:D-alanine-D-alanine ligase [Rhodothalassium salexigens DSM 2132]|uniref:D-alanine--D-alanine ligase n=1 Tax=Rhodothalassium salexigens DSM 2132 TaxID=1188247 RepID=A0A4R2PLC7_RHOSA|nr:D-alanine--D-alanine ligase [Rhodothalassium salexigens]MBB4210923.1 D-alanine-D-alanine ligase [Rhodothalassium salexigens DSM 2132]MBK1639472.1 hypothetical protein [Rhodothalassium salexigens DSM 2132]TCP36419.1 D-alanine-D-alanine ligase [Rhodothalassium salexigens DSM 2132]
MATAPAPKTTVAVFFGGRSVEHDVSILTGLQFLDALDTELFEPLAVYIDPQGQWWCGEALRRRSSYPLSGEPEALGIEPVTLPVGTALGDRPGLMVARKGLMGRSKVETIGFDVAVPALHGSNGEDGTIQGLFEFLRVPYAGCRPLGAAATMDKHFTKRALGATDIATLPHALVARPGRGTFLSEEPVKAALDQQMPGWAFPLLVKPRRLGSSVGVAPAADMDALMAALSKAFRLDDAALVEPLVANLVEYNVAVRATETGPVTSAIERPLHDGPTLDFAAKYRAGGGGPKLDDGPGEGMAAAGRALDPDELTDAQAAQIRRDAAAAFALFDLAGSVRVDFLCNGETGEIWLNELNTIPGSFAYYLWQAATPALGFTDLAETLVREGQALSAGRGGSTQADAGGATLFNRG